MKQSLVPPAGDNPLRMPKAALLAPSAQALPLPPKVDVRAVVQAWAAGLRVTAPPPQHRDFGEYILEHLDDLITKLGGQP